MYTHVVLVSPPSAPVTRVRSQDDNMFGRSTILNLSALFTGLFFAGATLSWHVADSYTTSSLRGLSVRANEIWASGTGGTYLHSADGGATWIVAHVNGAEKLDFRAVAAIDKQIFLVSSGPGDQSRIYGSPDKGKTWRLQFTNTEPKGFFDAVQFWNSQNGIVLGDPLDGHWDILTTTDAGAHWIRRQGPAAPPNEGAFAASGTCLIVRGKTDAWFVTGDKGGGRILHSTDSGQTWKSAAAPVQHDGPAAGILSIAFRDGLNGMVVGGDFSKPASGNGNVAITSDGGRTWRKAVGIGPHGYRSAVAYWPAQKAWLAVGISGSDISRDGGDNWQLFDDRNLNSVGVGDSLVAVGPKGVVLTMAGR